MRKIILATLGLIFALLFVGNAVAAQFQTSSDQNGAINIDTTAKPKDLHLVSSNITVNAPVTGDLVAVGQTILVTGNVENSLFLAGSDITVQGDVGHHLRAVGSNVTISSKVTGDVFVAGSTVIISKEAVISGSLYVAASNLTIDGKVVGGVHLTASDVAVSGSAGSVTGNLQTLTVSSSAIINGDLSYAAPEKGSISSDAKISGTVNFTQKSNLTSGNSLLSISSLLSALGTILLLLCFCRYWPALTQKLVTNYVVAPMPNFGWGLLGLIVLPILAIFLLISAIGTPFAVVSGLLWIVALFAGSLIGKLAIGNLIVKGLTKDQTLSLDWQAAVVGVIAVMIVKLVPVFGPLFVFVVIVIGFGAVAKTLLIIDKKPVTAA